MAAGASGSSCGRPFLARPAGRVNRPRWRSTSSHRMSADLAAPLAGEDQQLDDAAEHAVAGGAPDGPQLGLGKHAVAAHLGGRAGGADHGVALREPVLHRPRETVRQGGTRPVRHDRAGGVRQIEQPCGDRAAIQAVHREVVDGREMDLQGVVEEGRRLPRSIRSSTW